MRYLKHLSQFYDKALEEKTINPTHISLYMALYKLWITNQFKNPIPISRVAVMQYSKIASKVTYHKSIKHLHTKGYI